MELEARPHLDPRDSTDESLVWSLESFENHHRAVRFIRQFKSLLCVYSPKVHQLYGSYEVVVPRDQRRQLVVLPDLFSFHDTWYHLPRRALQRTGLLILPGDLVGRAGLHMRIPFGNGRRGRVVPLAQGLRTVRHDYRENHSDFLPVITRGDLRALRRRTPLLHLHRLDPGAMRDKSRFEIEDMAGTIRERLHKLTATQPTP